MENEHQPASRGAVQVGLSDRHGVMREALRMMLEWEPDVEVAATAATWQQVRELVEGPGSPRLDLLLLDYALVAGALSCSIHKLLGRDPTLPIIVLAMDRTNLNKPLALAAGARNYLLKDLPPAQLVQAIRDASRAADGGPTARATTESASGLSAHARHRRHP